MNAQHERYHEPVEPPDVHFLAAARVYPEVVLVLDRLGRVQYVSPIVQRLIGKAPGAIVGTHVGKWVHPDDLSQLYALVARRNREGVELPLVGRVCHSDGRWRWLEAVPLHRVGSEIPDQSIFLVREITGHRRLEQQYRMAESIAGFGVWRLELHRPVPELSPGMMRLFGYETGERAAGGKRLWPLSMVNPSDRSQVMETFRNAIKTPQLFSFCCRIRARDGLSKTLKTHGYTETDVNGVATALSGVSQDVTLISTVYRELESSEKRYRLLTDRASDIVSQLSVDGTIEFVSPAVKRILGRPPEELKGTNFSSLLVEGEQQQFAQFLHEVATGTQDVISTVRAKRADGRTRWLELSGRTLRDENENHTGIVCAARDVSERKKFEADLQAARLQAEDANASKSRFLTNVSHDLRTPLNAILGFAELIRDEIFGPAGDPRYVEYASLIHESGTMLRAFLTDLLDLSKIEAGRYDLHPERLELSEVVPSCVRQIMPRATKKHVEVEDGIPETGLELFVDRGALTHILLNLLSNSVKFTPDGGKIEVGARRENRMVALTVRDTGVGIKDEDIERITAPFEQSESAHGFAREGVGVGLAIVKSLAELHGGTLTIESEPGTGTCVTVRLPAANRSRCRAA